MSLPSALSFYPMRALLQPWFCYLSLAALTLFAFFAGAILQSGAGLTAYNVSRLLGDRPLAPLTRWFLALHTDYTSSLWHLAFYPTVATGVYLFFLFRQTRDEKERCARFALAAFTALTLTLTFLLVGLCSFIMPFLTIHGGFRTPALPPTPFVHQSIWIGLVALLVLAAFALIALLLSLRRPSLPPPSTS